MVEQKLLIVIGALIALIAIYLIIIAYLDFKVNKLRQENKLLLRMLEHYFQLEHGYVETSRSIAREVDRIHRIPPGWDL